ncbi:MAG: hypothetical protein IKG83_00030 [Prevotella sp.]|nr:hypothetical protein [Prevotella sp.]
MFDTLLFLRLSSASGLGRAGFGESSAGSRQRGVVSGESSAGSRQPSQQSQRAGRGGTRSKRAGKRQQAKAKIATA